jgi:hypothetical protein
MLDRSLVFKMQSFECFEMLLITFTYYITCFDSMNAKSGSKEECYFLLIER